MPSEATKTEAFTPGEYRVSRGAGGEPFSIESATRTLALVKTCGTHTEANANLFAAAPDLFLACKAALDGFPLGVGAVGCTSDDPDIRANADRCIREAREIMDQIRAALTKATGGAA